jgi:hypothetical protein
VSGCGQIPIGGGRAFLRTKELTVSAAESAWKLTVQSGSKATLPTHVMAGAGPPSTTTLLATRKVVDGRPAPAMTRIATVARLADC